MSSTTIYFGVLALYWAVLRRKKDKKGNNVHRADKFPVPKSDSVYGIRPGARRADHACTLLERSAGALLGAAAWGRLRSSSLSMRCIVLSVKSGKGFVQQASVCSPFSSQPASASSAAPEHMMRTAGRKAGCSRSKARMRPMASKPRIAEEPSTWRGQGHQRR